MPFVGLRIRQSVIADAQAAAEHEEVRRRVGRGLVGAGNGQRAVLGVDRRQKHDAIRGGASRGRGGRGGRRGGRGGLAGERRTRNAPRNPARRETAKTVIGIDGIGMTIIVRTPR